MTEPAGTPARRTAVVTGGGTGIGLAAAHQLVAAGVETLIAGRRPDRLESAAAALRTATAGALVHTVVADVSYPVGAGEVRDAAAELLGQVDVVIANAGSPAPPAGGDLASLADSWHATFRANTMSAVLLTAALDPLLTSPGGRVVVIGSAAAARGNSTPSYAAAKAALEAWVRTQANAFGPRGITINVVAPGYTADTELVAGRISAARHDLLVQAISLGRAASADEIASVIAFLASPGSSYITGQVVSADGGLRV